MTSYREILRLHSLGSSQRSIAREVQSSRDTVADLFEIVEARTKHGSTIFCTQYGTDDWYDRINTDSTQDSPINDAIMDRIVHNAYVVPIEGTVSMRERHGLVSRLKAGETT